MMLLLPSQGPCEAFWTSVFTTNNGGAERRCSLLVPFQSIFQGKVHEPPVLASSKSLPYDQILGPPPPLRCRVQISIAQGRILHFPFSWKVISACVLQTLKSLKTLGVLDQCFLTSVAHFITLVLRPPPRLMKSEPLSKGPRFQYFKQHQVIL